MVEPELDVVAISRVHIERIFREQFQLKRFGRELWRNGPELLDLASRLPELLVQSGHRLESTPAPPAMQRTLAGLRGAIVAAACILGGVLTLLQSEGWLAGSGLLFAGWWIYWRGD